MRLGGLGLRSASRAAAGAYWASWADALYMIDERLPAVSATIVEHLTGAADGCFGARHIGSRGVRDETVLTRIATRFEAPFSRTC